MSFASKLDKILAGKDDNECRKFLNSEIERSEHRIYFWSGINKLTAGIGIAALSTLGLCVFYNLGIGLDREQQVYIWYTVATDISPYILFFSASSIIMRPFHQRRYKKLIQKYAEKFRSAYHSE